MYSDCKPNFDKLLEKDSSFGIRHRNIQKDSSFGIRHRNIQTLAIEIFQFLNGRSPPR